MPASTRYPVRENVLGFDPYSPGLSIDEIKEKFNLTNVIKLASNENPLGTSPLVKKRLQDAAALAFRYPQGGNPKLVKALAKHYEMPENTIVVGNGSDEIIDLLIRVCPTPGIHNIVASKPSFSMYRLQSKLCGVEFRTVPLTGAFAFDWQGLLAAIDGNTAMIFLTAPDNPSGYCPSIAELEAFIKQVPETCLVVVDEAYTEFCDQPGYGTLLPQFDRWNNLIILRTFSKIAGLAGIRLGYGFLPVMLAEVIRAVKPPFSVNILAEEAGLAILEDEDFLTMTKETVVRGRAYLTNELKRLGSKVFPSQANFLMFSLPDNCPFTPRQVFEKLLESGMIIRPLSSYGLPDYLRISIGTEDENRKFLALFTHLLGNAAIE